MRRGFSVLELSLALVLLSIGLLVSFSLFERGTRAVFKSDARMGLSDEARRVLVSIGSDLRKSDLGMSQVLDDASRSATGLSGNSVMRAALCYPTLSSWTDPTRFNPDRAQIYWDRYTVLYATRQTPGRLVLQVHAPALVAPATHYTTPMVNLSVVLNDDPGTNAGSLVTRTLSQSVEHFDAVLDPEVPEVRIKLVLARRGSRKVGARQLDERAEALMTYPVYNGAPP